MAKQKINEEFQRMQKLAGIKLNEDNSQNLEKLQQITSDIGSFFDYDLYDNGDGKMQIALKTFYTSYDDDRKPEGEDLTQEIISLVKDLPFNDKDWLGRPLLTIFKDENGYNGIIKNPKNKDGYSFVSVYQSND